MDLSMILSPVEEDDSREHAPPPQRPRRQPPPPSRWSRDEMQCAVAILRDFHAPPAQEGPQQVSPARNSHCARWPPLLAARVRDQSDDDDEEEDDEEEDEEGRATEDDDRHSVASSGCAARADESSLLLSKLDLLVQADAMITQSRPTTTEPKVSVETHKRSPIKRGRKKQQDQDTSRSTDEFTRSGVWTKDEEAYAAALIYYFLNGTLPIQEGTTLRKYLAEQLSCNRRRISMKLATESIGNRKVPRKVGATVFVGAQPPPSQEEIHEMNTVLERLRNLCFSNTPLSSPTKENRPHHVARASPKPTPSHQPAVSHRRYSDDGKSPVNCKRRRPTIIRTGFETPEEETYATTLFECFMDGVLDLPEGTKLISFLCEKLECSTKTLSMKLAPRKLSERKFPDNLGSITYEPTVLDPMSEQVAEAEAKLSEARQMWLDAQPQDHNAHQTPPLQPIKTSPKLSKSTPPSPVFSRSGPWSKEEEEYAAALIDCFFKGALDIAEGTSLRAFLASRLTCNPMRISKKLASECIASIKIPKKLGSSTFVLNEMLSTEERARAEHMLHELHQAYVQAEMNKEQAIESIKNQRDDRWTNPEAHEASHGIAPRKQRKLSSSDKEDMFYLPPRISHRSRYETASSKEASSYERVVPYPYQQVA
ncbi:TPA: hypothetical protein N0F65_003722 [Lagenidium giganteum]|uniref:Uncharacterized protein n=1 Tax=Lagenidium giganteum TaxID=4803 RepID=A0AAV2YYG5_9STRA|nr:TPA: hypothetical protein N0F65_003722 [Lagenidium giganteum]